MDDILFQARKDMILELMSNKTYKPMKLKELCMFLGVPKSEKEELKTMLDRLISEGKLSMNENGRYKIAPPDLMTGVFSGNARGFGFVTVEGCDTDVFIPEEYTKDALNGDKVRIRITCEASGSKRAEGMIVEVSERANTEVVGTYEKNKNFGFVIPDNMKFARDIFVSKEHSKGAVTGHKVVVKLTDYGGNRKNPEGIVTEILGHVNDPGTDVISIVKAFGLPTEYPEEVMRQLETIPEALREEDYQGRRDLRHLKTVTIDGEDAKDLDDAITLEKKGSHYLLGVHIADVSHYVREGSPLDKEALKRGTSVYLVDRVIPMLPHKLSNGICSLNQGEDRLALSCLMDINEKGIVVGNEIAETVINVNHRMTYTAVNEIITNRDEQTMKVYEDFVPMFQLMKELSELLRSRRKQRGGIDFDFPESKIVLDEKGYPIDVHPYERNAATKLIEDFMLVANETIAEDFYWQELPFLYRTHETPDMERIQKLAAMISKFGYYMKLGREEIHPKEFQKLLGKVQDTPEEAMISRLALRSMKQAKYTTENIGHFGLAVKYYCHFTSPIRRYPDLQIHRIIKENLAGRLDEKRQNHYFKLLPDVAVSTSVNERRADDAEREVIKLKKVEFMSKHIGEIFDGVISGLTTWGMYVELPNTCEGMVRVADMEDDYYFYDEQQMAMIGEMTRQTYSLGDHVQVLVTHTDKLMKTIDFMLIDQEDLDDPYFMGALNDSKALKGDK